MKKIKVYGILVLCGMLSCGGTALQPQRALAAGSAANVSQTMQEGILQITVNAAAPGDGAASKDSRLVVPTIQAALDEWSARKAVSAIIYLQPGTYREKLVIRQPNLTLIGMGKTPGDTRIVWNDAEGTLVRPEDGGDGTAAYKMECATIKLQREAKNFCAVNLSFINDFDTAAAREAKMKSPQAFALTDEADQSSFWDCRFLGHQDTLFANAGRQYYEGCYIEGDVDFIFGAGTAVFRSCELHSLERAGAVKGYIAAPSTLAENKGFLFDRCRLTAQLPAGSVKLGRPWHPSDETRPVDSCAVFRECQMGAHIAVDAWSSMKNKYAVFEPQDNRLFEYQSRGEGAVIHAGRRQLTAEQAKTAVPRLWLDGWKPAEPEVQLP